jgi:hypothetical protein
MSASVTPTPAEIRIVRALCWDVRENLRSWDDAITRAAANLGLSRAAVLSCVTRCKDWIDEDAKALR